MKTIKELELSLIVKEAMIQQLKFKNNQLEEKINRASEYINNIKKKWINESVPERNIYLFETYINGITELIKIKDILKGVDKE